MTTNTDKIDYVSFPNISELPDGQYKTILADPPWKYDDDTAHKGAADHYSTLPVEVIQAMGPYVNKIAAPHAHLYLWVTNAFLEHAWEIAEAWGFTPKSVITWLKVKDEPNSLPHERDKPESVEINSSMGQGHSYRNTTEHLLFCQKGTLKLDEGDRRSHLFAERSAHSQKPEKSYRLIEEVSEEPRLELFARSERNGWDVWGNEV